MSRRPAPRLTLLLGGLFSLAFVLPALGCALTSRSEASAPRYFSPERRDESRSASAPASGRAMELRLGRVTGASYLDDRLVYRSSAHELGYYQERRWTEAPERYLRRRAARVLFEERGVKRVIGGAAATLELELVAFEEIRTPRRTARVQVIARLHGQHTVRWEETLTVDQIILATHGDSAAAAVEALGAALGLVVDRIADHVLSELAAWDIAGRP